MGVAKDIVATISNLAYWMAKERTEDSLRELRKLKELLPEPAREEAEEIFDAMETFIKEGQFDDAWEQYEVLADIVTRYTEDPPNEERAKKEKDILHKMILLGYWMGVRNKNTALDVLLDTEDSIKKLIGDEQFKDSGLEDLFERLYDAIDERQWTDAFEIYNDIATVLMHEVIKDPPLTTWLPEETYEGYEKAAKIVGETKSRYAREVLEGRRTPVEPPNGIRAKERAERIAKPKEKKAEWQSIIEEAEKQEEADWERTIREAEKPTEADWETLINKYRQPSQDD